MPDPRSPSIAVHRGRHAEIRIIRGDGQFLDIPEADALTLAESIRDAFAMPLHADGLAARSPETAWSAR